MSLSPEEDFFNALYLSIGQLVIPFGFVDQSLSQWVAMIYQSYRNDHNESKIPHELRRKIEFLKRCFGTIKPLHPFNDEVTGIFKRLHPVIDARHFLIHGTLTKHQPGCKKFTFSRLDTTPKIHRLVSRSFTFDRILSLGNECLSLSTQTIDLSHRLLNAIVPEDKRDNLAGKI